MAKNAAAAHGSTPTANATTTTAAAASSTPASPPPSPPPPPRSDKVEALKMQIALQESQIAFLDTEGYMAVHEATRLRIANIDLKDRMLADRDEMSALLRRLSCAEATIAHLNASIHNNGAHPTVPIHKGSAVVQGGWGRSGGRNGADRCGASLSSGSK